jgi:O-antigen ligase
MWSTLRFWFGLWSFIPLHIPVQYVKDFVLLLYTVYLSTTVLFNKRDILRKKVDTVELIIKGMQ